MRKWQVKANGQHMNDTKNTVTTGHAVVYIVGNWVANR